MKKKLNLITITFLSAAVLSLSSCLKDDGRYINFAGSKPTVELPLESYNGVGSLVAESYNIVSAPTLLPCIVNVAAPNPLTYALKVTLEVDTAALTAYNSANGTNYTLLPAADYTVPSWVVTIPANVNLDTLKISINTSLIDPSQQYILPISIANASGVTINQFHTLLYNVQVKNAYDGNYTANGFVFRDIGAGANDATLGGNFSGVSVPLATVSGTAVSWAPLWASGSDAGGVGGTTLTVNPSTNAVTIASSANATLKNATGYNSRYDPSTKTFYISYTWGVAPSDRAETDTLVYSSAR